MRARHLIAGLLLASASTAFSQTGNGVLRSQADVTSNAPGCFGFQTSDGRNICLPAMVPVDPTTGNLAVGSGGGGGGGAVSVANGADIAEGSTGSAAYSDTTLAAAGSLVSLNKGQFGLLNAISNKLPNNPNPLQAGGTVTVANGFFGARLQSADGTAFGTAGNPVIVTVTNPGSGGGGGAVTIANGADVVEGNNTDAAGAASVFGMVKGIYGYEAARAGTKQAVTEADGDNTAVGSRADAPATTTDTTPTTLIAQVKQLVQRVNALLVAQGSTTSGQNGQLVMGAVTSGAPAYTAGQTSPIALTQTGEVRAMLSTSGNVLGVQTGTATLAAANYGLATNARLYLYNGTAGVLGVDATAAPTTGAGVGANQVTPTSIASGGIPPIFYTATAGQAIKASAGNLFSWRATQASAALKVVFINATTVPANGATIAPLVCEDIAAANGVAGADAIIPDRFTTGIVALTSNSCTTYSNTTGTVNLRVKFL